jgi:hypothetical protein
VNGHRSSGYWRANPIERIVMPSLINRVTSFGRSPKGQSMIRQAMSRFTGGNDTRKGRRGTGSTRRKRSARRR